MAPSWPSRIILRVDPYRNTPRPVSPLTCTRISIGIPEGKSCGSPRGSPLPAKCNKKAAKRLPVAKGINTERGLILRCLWIFEVLVATKAVRLSRRRSRVRVSSLPPYDRLKCKGSWNPPAHPFLLAPSSRDFEGHHGEVDRITGY